MKVDRESFLTLVTALATSVCLAPGCNSAQQPPPEEPQAPTTATTNQSTAVIAIPAQPPAQPVFTAPPPPPPPAPPVVAAASTTPAKSPNPYSGDPVTAQTCDPAQNKVGTPASCSTLKAPGPTCESFHDTKTECPTLTTLLKPKVAAAAIDCLKRKSGTQEICEFNITSICAYEALGQACIEPYAKSSCDAVMKRCGDGPKTGHYNKMTRESCEAGVSGIADGKRKKFLSCITEMCRFETCLTYL